MRRIYSALFAGALTLALGCEGDKTTAPPMVASSAEAANWDGGTPVQAMTQNVYVGADVDKVIAALASPDPSDDLPALLNAIEVLRNTDFPTRAAQIAKQIATTQPQVIGLQEISKIDIDLLVPGQESMISVHVDFLPILMEALTARGLNYAVAVQHEQVTAAPFAGVSLKDYDVILIDANRVRVGPEDLFGRHFQNNLGEVAPGVFLTRGMVGIRAHMGQREFYVLNTHLESGSGAALDALRLAQAQELLNALGERPHAILMGDFNTTQGTPAYRLLRQHELKDLWVGLNPGYPGYTCCQQANLRNELPKLTQRIDFIFARSVGETPAEHTPWIKCVGDDSRDRVAGPYYGLWPSDHAGVVSYFELHGR
jgi:endonuclease/exonuclease/phosphatase family metal-dependent hydrolase